MSYTTLISEVEAEEEDGEEDVVLSIGFDFGGHTNIFQKTSYFHTEACLVTFYTNLRVGNLNLMSKILQLNYFASCKGPE